MNKRNASMPWPVLAVLVISMLSLGLACGGEKATPTSVPPTATRAATATPISVPPTATVVPTATATLVPGETPVATAVPTATSTAVPEPTATETALTWIERYMQSPGYQPEWGQPQTGGIFKQRMSRGPSNFTPNEGSTSSSNYNQPIYNPLVRFDPWVGMTSIIGDLARSWEWSDDMLHLTMKLEEGVKFQDNPNVPAEYNGGKITGDEFVCEDVQASVERHVRPPKWETKMAMGAVMLEHLNGVSCPDGPRGYTAVLNFDVALGKTMAALAQGTLVMLDKDWIEWYNAEHPAGLATVSPKSFLWGLGTGPFVPVEFNPDVVAKMRRNPTYFRDGLPLVNGHDLHILKDYTTAFTALATGQINYFGHGGWAMFPGQAEQAARDFPDRIVVHPVKHVYGYGAVLNFDHAPFDDRRVRTALNLAVDRDDYLLFRKAGAFPGAALMAELVPGTYWSPTEEELRTWPGLRQPHDQDVAEANRLLDEVFGAGKRFKTSCLVSGIEYFDYCLFFKDQLKRHLNIDVDVVTVEAAVGTQMTESCQQDTNAGASGGNTIVGDPDDYLYRAVHRRTATTPSAICKTDGWSRAEPVVQEELEALIDAQSTEVDPVKRRELVVEIEWKMFTELIDRITFGWHYSFPGVTKNVRGFYFYDLPTQSNWTLWERVWLAQ